MPFYSWTIAGPSECNVRCGYDGAPIPEDEPVQEIRREGLKRVLLRCARHAHTEVDWAQVDQAKHAKEVRLAEERHPAQPQPARKPKAFSSIGEVFDPKALAAGSDK